MKADLKRAVAGGNPALSYPDYDNNNDRLAYYSRGWKPSDTYTKEELVMYRGGLYVYTSATPSTPGTAPVVGSPDWDLIAYAPNSADLWNPANFAPGSSFTAIQNWGNSDHNGDFQDTPPNATTGVVTAPRTGFYDVAYNLVFQQGNTNKELAILAWLRRTGSNPGDVVINAIQVSDDKTNWRAMSGGFRVDLVANDTIQLGLSWINESIGTINFSGATFEVTLQLPLDTIA